MATAFRFEATAGALSIGLRGICFTLVDVENGTGDDDFHAYLRAQYRALQRRYSGAAISDDGVIDGFRRLRENMGMPRRRHPASPEGLIKRVVRDGAVPGINRVVDLYNLVSVDTRLSMGAHDIGMIDGAAATLKVANGDERFVPLGRSEPEPVRAGEFCYVDGGGEIICRMDHRQCNKTRVGGSTDACFYIVQGNTRTSHGYVQRAVETLVDLTRRYCGGRVAAVFPFG